MATLLDLNGAAQSDTHVASDICVIGAGAAGLYLANRLSRAGLSITVLEAGGATCESGAAIGIEPIFAGSPYRGAEEGRAFGWGGTTSKWGGLLAPYSELDRRDAMGPDATAWAHVVNAVNERGNAVFSALGLRGPTDFLSLPEVTFGTRTRLLRECGLEVMAAEALPFWRRNLTYLMAGQKGRSVAVFLNAVASTWSARPAANGSGAVNAVDATSANGKKLHVSAKFFVIAAGAIESARILLEIDRATEGRMFPSSASIGTFLSDHLSCAIADVRTEDRDKAATLFGPFFSKGRMRTLRFVERSIAPLLPRHFAHFIFDIDNPGFRLAKEALFGLQSKSLRDIRLANVVAGIGGLSSLAYHRLVRSRLFIPADTPAHLQLDIEQAPDSANRISLGSDTDRFGRPVAVVRWRVNDVDHENMRALSQRLLMKWPDSSPGFPRLVPLHMGDTQPKPYDAYHPVGACRMGTDKAAVADLDLRVRGTRNLYVLSTAVFPSAGTANPTFSMLCLGDMLADRLAKNDAASSVAGLIH